MFLGLNMEEPDVGFFLHCGNNRDIFLGIYHFRQTVPGSKLEDAALDKF